MQEKIQEKMQEAKLASQYLNFNNILLRLDRCTQAELRIIEEYIRGLKK